jgi:hypothetical protein
MDISNWNFSDVKNFRCLIKLFSQTCTGENLAIVFKIKIGSTAQINSMLKKSHWQKYESWCLTGLEDTSFKDITNESPTYQSQISSAYK